MNTKQKNTTTRGNDDALQHFIARKAQIDTLIAEIADASEDHFSVSPGPRDEVPGGVNWGHVGTLFDYAGLLQRVADSIYKRGEHAGSAS